MTTPDTYVPMTKHEAAVASNFGKGAMLPQRRTCVDCPNPAIGRGLRCGPCFIKRAATQEMVRQQRKRDQCAATPARRGARVGEE